MMIRKLYKLILLIMVGLSANAQDPQFSQFYSSPLYLNPALTGNTLQSRITGIYRHQWPSIPGAFVSYGFSYDHNLPGNSGLGVQFLKDKAGAGGLRFTNVGGFYSYQVNITRFQFIKAGIGVSYSWRDLDYSRLTFEDQLLAEDDNPTAEVFYGETVNYLDFSSGVIYASNQFWIGAAMHHINKPNQSLMGANTTARLPIKFSVHGGIEIPIKKNTRENVVQSMIPVVIYKAQQKWDQLDIGTYYKYDALIVGAWYRGIPLLKAYKKGYSNNDAFVFMLGYKKKGFGFGYSYDITISRLMFNTGGSHEVTFLYEFVNPKRKKRKMIKIPCAKIL